MRRRMDTGLCRRPSISGGQIPRSLLRLLREVIVARMSEYIHQSHNVSILMYHLVCPAKYRRVVFDASVDTVLKEVCLEIAKRYAIIFLEIGTDKDHVHFLIQSIPTYSPTKIVKTIKSITAREVLKRVPAVKKRLWGGEFWSKGSFISTVGRHGNEEVIRQYVRQQGSDKGYTQLHRHDVQVGLFSGAHAGHPQATRAATPPNWRGHGCTQAGV